MKTVFWPVGSDVVVAELLFTERQRWFEDEIRGKEAEFVDQRSAGLSG